MQVFLDKTKRQKAPLIKKEKAMLLFPPSCASVCANITC
jgi:hypothetical protein